MIHGKMNKRHLYNLLTGVMILGAMSACGGGSSCGNCTTPGPNGGQLIFVAPSILPSLANKSGINYMGVYNPSDVTISGISYSMGQQVGSGNSITLDQTSAVNCASIAAKSSCFLKFSVPESTIAGGTVVTASNSDGSEAATPLAIGVQQVPYTESANANGVGLYFYSKAQYSESGVPFILVTAVVQSPNVGTINTIELVDESGNVISGQVVTSNNSGPGNSPLQMGDVVEISLPLPQGINLTQNIKIQTSYQTLETSALNSLADKLNLKNQSLKAIINKSTGSTIYSVTTQGNNINLQFTPNQVYLTQQNSIQYGYLYNIGDLTASQIQVSSSSPNVRVTAADEILNGQRVIKVTYELINTSVVPATNLVTVTAQNPSGQTQTSTGGTSQNVNPLPVPTPSPSPAPTPTPTPTPGPPPPPPGPTLIVTVDRDPVAGGECSTITVTAPSPVSSDTTVTVAVPAGSYGFASSPSGPFLPDTTCTIFAGSPSPDSCVIGDGTGLCTAVNTTGTPINITASASGYSDGTEAVQAAGVIFYTTNNTPSANQGLDANLKGQAETASGLSIANGVAGADYFCNTDANKPPQPAGATYKALISVAGIRNPEYSGNPAVDWVLKPEQRYVRAATPGALFTTDYVTIGVTNASSVFGFPLESGIVASKPFNLPQLFYTWTGLDSDWTPLSDNCAGYTSTSGTSGKIAGWVYNNPGSPPVITTSEVIKQTTNDISCNFKTSSSRKMGLICVQQ